MQAHLSRQTLPISDYLTDTKSVLDNSLRLCQAMLDLAADSGWLVTCLATINLVQSLMQVGTINLVQSLMQPHGTTYIGRLCHMCGPQYRIGRAPLTCRHAHARACPLCTVPVHRARACPLCTCACVLVYYLYPEPPLPPPTPSPLGG